MGVNSSIIPAAQIAAQITREITDHASAESLPFYSLGVLANSASKTGCFEYPRKPEVSCKVASSYLLRVQYL